MLARMVLSEPDKDPIEASQVAIKSVFEFYRINHGSKTRSAHVSDRAMQLCEEFLKTATDQPLPSVATFTLMRQHAFMKHCADMGLSTKSISIYMSQIKAAINYASVPRIICDSKGQEREGQMLKSSTYVIAKSAEISKITSQPMPKPRSFIPTDEQLVAFIGQIRREWLFRYVIIALNTWARPEANLELDIRKQVDFTVGIVDLNQEGRRQNNKVRPIIPLTDNLRGWLLHWDKSKPINRKGNAVTSVRHSDFRAIAQRAGVAIKPYTLRHYMATRIRRLPEGIRPEREERAAWLGHVDPHYRTTEEWYESQDPHYLEKCRQGVDAIMTQLNLISPRSLFAPNTVQGTGLTVVAGDDLPLGNCGEKDGEKRGANKQN